MSRVLVTGASTGIGRATVVEATSVKEFERLFELNLVVALRVAARFVGRGRGSW